MAASLLDHFCDDFGGFHNPIYRLAGKLPCLGIRTARDVAGDIALKLLRERLDFMLHNSYDWLLPACI